MIQYRVLFLILILTAVTVYVISMATKSNTNHQTAKKLKSIFISLESKYLNFIEKRLNNQIIEQNNFDFDEPEIVRKALLIIKPEIESLFSIVAINRGNQIRLNYNPDFFINSLNLCLSLMGKGGTLQNSDETKFFESFRTAIKSDIANRIMELKSGS